GRPNRSVCCPPMPSPTRSPFSRHSGKSDNGNRASQRIIESRHALSIGVEEDSFPPSYRLKASAFPSHTSTPLPCPSEVDNTATWLLRSWLNSNARQRSLSNQPAV